MTRNNMIKKIEIISPGTGLCPNRFSEVNFTLVETERLGNYISNKYNTIYYIIKQNYFHFVIYIA